MMKTTFWKSCLLLLPLLAFAACGGDDGTGPADTELTEQEVGEMMEALAAAGAFSPPSPQEGSGTSAPNAPARTTFDYDVETTASCPGGGSVSISGSVQGDVDDQTGEGDFDVTMTQSHQDCVASSDAGTTFTFNSSPGLQTSMDFTTTSDGSYSITGSHSGSLGWTTGEKSGSCSVDISYDFSGSQSSFSGSAQGTVCGVDVSHSLDVTAS